ncbi:MAG TPA: hypothetical protein VFT71_06440 [Candidatus Nitrosocosmicus sp.]|nr:hypothetical protein [Candidatus Nitrosocosmicus sp.]
MLRRRRRHDITILFSFLTVFTIVISIDLQLSFVNSAFALDKEINNSII